MWPKYAYETTEHYAHSYIKSIDFDKREQLSQWWYKNERNRTLEKYEYLLEYLKNEKFNKGTTLYQNLDILIKLRNYFVHYQPEKIYNGEKYIANIGQKLKGKFPLNPAAPDHTPFFPYKCLSYGCAIWGINSVLDFTETFARKIEWVAFGSYTRDMVNKILIDDIDK